MIEKYLGRYRIDAKLGEGGMGVVWRAHDPQLEREVALKVLPDALVADAEARARLVREARSAAALNHPNILTVYEVGEADGHVYIAMEFIPGRPLSQRVGDPRLALADVIRLGLQISAALAHAHERGVVHRDVKPSNVLVTTTGDAKVLDFGIATRVTSETSETRSIDMTQPGSLTGTPNAMAPELWSGARADTRSDVWAFGALLHALLSGAPPYQGTTTYELATAICTTDPPPLPENVPPALRAVVTRCLAREPERRFRSASEAHAALEAIAAGAVHSHHTAGADTPRPQPAPAGRRSFVPLAIGAVLVVAALALLAWLRLGGGAGAGNAPIRSLAVLPLDNFSHDAEQQFFADGMTEELITRLAQMGFVRVISRTSVMRFRGTTLALPEIAKQLGVDAIVEGSVEQSGGRVRISAQLVRAATDEHVWARSYEREVGDALALQDEIATSVAHELRATLAPASSSDARSADTATRTSSVPADALQAYLRGRDQYQKWTIEGVRRALRYYDQALAADSTFAPALAARASALFFLGSTPDTIALGRAAMERALTLAPDRSEPHAARAKLLLERDWNWAESEREFRRAIELDPNDADAHHHYSHLLAALGRIPEAQEQARIFMTLDPLAPASFDHAVWIDYMVGDFEQARIHFRRTMELDPNYARGPIQFASVTFAQRHYEETRALFEQASRLGEPLDPLTLRILTAIEAGHRDEAAHLARTMLSSADPFPHDWTDAAGYAAAVGDRESAFTFLDSALAIRSYPLLTVNIDPAFASLRSDPRYAALRARMRLPK